MKKHLILSVAALLMGLSSFAAPVNPSDGPVVNRASYRAAVYPSSVRAGEIRVAVDRFPGEAMTIVLKDAHGRVLGRKQISPKLDKFQFRFVLGEAPDGAYTVEIQTPRDQSRHAFTLQTQPGVRVV